MRYFIFFLLFLFDRVNSQSVVSQINSCGYVGENICFSVGQIYVENKNSDESSFVTNNLLVKDNFISTLVNTIFPNPVIDYLFFNFEKKNKYIDIEVIDMSGRLIMKKTNVEENYINLITLQKGIYLVRFNYDQNQMITFKIIKK